MHHAHTRSSAKSLFLHFLCAGLALTIAGCAGTPTNGVGIPWWPQGPGDTPVEADSGASADRAASSRTAESAPERPLEAPPENPALTHRQPQPPAPSPEPATAPGSVAPVANTTPTQAPAPGQYTQAARYGDLVFVSGQIANNPATGQIVGGDIDVQMRAAMDNVQRVLEGQGMTMSNVVSVTLYLKHINDLQKADKVYESYFRRNLPARTVIEASDLPRGSLVQVSVVAGR